MAKAAKPPAAPTLEVVSDPYALVRGPFLGKWLVLGRTFCGFRAIGRQVHTDGVTPGVVHRVISDVHKRHYPSDENTACQSFLAGIKVEMTTHGASALAVQWVMELEPDAFSEKDLQIMADKLSKPVGKGGALKADKTDKPKPKGNPEALAKARAAQGAKKEAQLADKRKITLTEKGKEKVKKGGESGAVKNLIAMRDAKTVGAAIGAGLTMADVNYAEKSETISVG